MAIGTMQLDWAKGVEVKGRAIGFDYCSLGKI
jgi:hypothetical protein